MQRSLMREDKHELGLCLLPAGSRSPLRSGTAKMNDELPHPKLRRTHALAAMFRLF
jgi:hypothetical protein